MKDHPIIPIKVCGMTQTEQVSQLAEMGIKYAGFIFYEKSPRYVAGKINPDALKNGFADINKVGVFVNEDFDTIVKTVDKYGLNYAQLHGDETPEFCKKVSNYIKTIKAFRLTGNENIASVTDAYTSAADMFLFDTKTEAYGGSGKKFNWDVLQESVINKPFFLSGGIGPEDTQIIKDFSEKNIFNNTFLLDVNSKFEDAPGLKNMEKVKSFASLINSKTFNNQ